MALACILTISCVSFADGRGWNFVPLSKKSQEDAAHFGVSGLLIGLCLS
jgi:hypothetical protein